MSLDHLRLQDMSDREVLLVMIDVAGGDYVEAHDIATKLGMSGDAPHRAVSSRLAWLRRYGAVERELLWDENGNPIMSGGVQRTSQRWRPTDVGRAIAMGKLDSKHQRAVDRMDDGAALLMTRAIAGRAQGGGATGSKLIEREWRHQWLRAS